MISAGSSDKEAALEHLTELLKIIDGGLRHDAAKVRRYADLLVKNLEDEGEDESAALLRKAIGGVRGRGIRAAESGPRLAVPVDAESRLTVGDLSHPSLEDAPLVISSEAQSALDDFITAYRRRDALLKAGLSGPGHVLLYGPPGCGKTQAAKCVAAQLQLPLLTGRLDGLVSSFLGSTAKNIRALFDFADKTPCILFLDEFDAVAKMRDDEHELGELKRVVNSLIQNIDHLPPGSSVLAATNHEHLLDPAVWRRFEFHVEITPPTEEARQQLLRLYSRNSPHARVVDILAALTEGFTASEIEGLATYLARRLALNGQTKLPLREAVHGLVTYRARSTGNNRNSPWPEELDQLIPAWRKLWPRVFTYDVISEIFGISRSKISALVKGSRSG